VSRPSATDWVHWQSTGTHEMDSDISTLKPRASDNRWSNITYVMKILIRKKLTNKQYLTETTAAWHLLEKPVKEIL